VPGDSIMENRRTFIKKASSLALSSGFVITLTSCSDLMLEEDAISLPLEPIPEGLFFKISLAQWSLRKSLWSGNLTTLDFASTARNIYGIDAIEYVNQFFIDKGTDTIYLTDLKNRASDHGVKSLIIMIDMEGNLATLNEANRKKAVDNHYKWIDAAKFLGCHSIRVNAAGKGDRDNVAKAAIESLGTLCDYGEKEGINIIVENHGGYSSDPGWLTHVIQQVGKKNCGILPDFGNFVISIWPPKFYDTYKGMEELMPYAMGVSAKSRDFDSSGQHKTSDFRKILQIVKDSGFTGYIGIEYEGYKLSSEAGIKSTRHLLIESAKEIG
jgi:sugar phosphate isomerase/epimerase